MSDWAKGYEAGKQSQQGELQWHRAEVERLRAEIAHLHAEITRLRMTQERMRCLMCGAITRNDQCDCTRQETGRQRLVNYADALDAELKTRHAGHAQRG